MAKKIEMAIRNGKTLKVAPISKNFGVDRDASGVYWRLHYIPRGLYVCDIIQSKLETLKTGIVSFDDITVTDVSREVFGRWTEMFTTRDCPLESAFMEFLAPLRRVWINPLAGLSSAVGSYLGAEKNL